MNCLLIVGPLLGDKKSEVKIHIRTYSDSITLVRQGAGGIEGHSYFN